jgi:hypothetical protein
MEDYIKTLGQGGYQTFQAALDGPDASDGSLRWTRRVVLPDGGGVDTVPAAGCVPASARAIFGSVVPDDIRVNGPLQIVMTSVLQKADDAPAVVAATPGWRRCVQARTGHSFAEPVQIENFLNQYYKQHGLTKSAHAVELRYARISVTCKYQSGLERAYDDAMWRYAQTITRKNYRWLIRIQQWDRHAALVARRVLRKNSLHEPR